MLKDLSGRNEESLQTVSETIQHLYDELAEKYAFPWPAQAMRPAVNDAVVNWDFSVSEGDRIIFLPPPSGG